MKAHIGADADSGLVHSLIFTKAKVPDSKVDHQRIFDAGNDFHAAATDAARFDVDIEYTLQTLRPAHCCMACNRCCAFLPVRFGLTTSASPRRRHQRAMLAVGCEHAIIARQIDPWFRHQRRQPGNEVQRLKNHMRRTIPIGRLELGSSMRQ